MSSPIKTRSEQRLAQLEATRRPLTKAESNELRKCLHAIYMRHWRLSQSIHGHVGGELLEVQKRARVETNAIAYRMGAAVDADWPIPRVDDWQEHARTASDQLRDTILRAQGKLERVAA
jgi:hypothetical protein